MSSKRKTFVKNEDETDVPELPGFYYDKVKKKYFRQESSSQHANNYHSMTYSVSSKSSDELNHVRRMCYLDYLFAQENSSLNLNLYGRSKSISYKSMNHVRNDYVLYNSSCKYKFSLSDLNQCKIENFSLLMNERRQKNEIQYYDVLFDCVESTDNLMSSIMFTQHAYKIGFSGEITQLKFRNFYAPSSQPVSYTRQKFSKTSCKLQDNFMLSTNQENNRNSTYFLDISYLCKSKSTRQDQVLLEKFLHKSSPSLSTTGHNSESDTFIDSISLCKFGNFKSPIWCSTISDSIYTNAHRSLKCAVGMDNCAIVCELNSRNDTLKSKMNTKNSSVYSVCFGSDYMIYTGCKNKFVYGFDLRTDVSKNRCRYLQHESCVSNLIIHKYNSNLLFTNDFTGVVYLWDVRMNKKLNCYVDENIKFDSKYEFNITDSWKYLYTVGKDAKFRIWNLETNQICFEMESTLCKNESDLYKCIPKVFLFDNLSFFYLINNQFEYYSAF